MPLVTFLFLKPTDSDIHHAMVPLRKPSDAGFTTSAASPALIRSGYLVNKDLQILETR